MMNQICLSEQSKQKFYFSSRQVESKTTRWISVKIAAAVMCIVLLVPITVLALESVFDIAIINSIDRPNAYNCPGVGVDVKYGNVSSRPITDFSEHLQSLADSENVTYDSWEEAQRDLGIELLDNPVCSEEKTQKIDYYVDGELVRKHCIGRYLVEDGQLSCAMLSAVYRRSSVEYQITATVTAEHPSITEDALRQYHESSATYFDTFTPQVETRQYVTKSGIPATICTVKMEVAYGTFTDYKAYLAVDDVTYCVSCIGVKGRWDDERVSSVLLEVLDGFVVE